MRHRRAAAAIGGQVVVKAQVLSGGRGKAGGVKLANLPEEAGAVAAQILGLRIGGEPVRRVLVAPAVDISREIYLGVVIDRTAQSLVLMASAEGGVDIEEVAATNPSAILREAVDPLAGLPDWQARQIGFALGLDGPQNRQFVRVAQGSSRHLWRSMRLSPKLIRSWWTTPATCRRLTQS